MKITRRDFCVEIAATAAIVSTEAMEISSMINDFHDEYVDSDFDEDEETLDDLKYHYLGMLEGEGCLNEVVFGRPEWDEYPDVYTMEYHGVEKLIAMVPEDVLVRQFGEYRVLSSMEASDRMRGRSA